MSRTPASRQRDRYGEAPFRRTALAPGLLTAIVLLAGIALIGGDAYLVIRYVVAILACIIGWFAIQARHWWWLLPLAAIAVLWNPIVPIPAPDELFLGAHYVAILVVVLAGLLIKVPNPDAGRAGSAQRRR